MMDGNEKAACTGAAAGTAAGGGGGGGALASVLEPVLGWLDDGLSPRPASICELYGNRIDQSSQIGASSRNSVEVVALLRIWKHALHKICEVS
jgi:hypothetical protein